MASTVKSCGCTIGKIKTDPFHFIKWCPLHASAEQMLEMLKTVHYEGAGMHYDAISELIAAAQEE